MNTEFEQLIASIDYDHYFDSEAWVRDVYKTPYDLIQKDGFAILIEYYHKFGKKIGFSRGGIRFDRKAKNLEAYKQFADYLQHELKHLGYLYVGIDHTEEENEYTAYFQKTDIRPFVEGSAFVYPKENWIQKFNSKKRYDLTFAGKKGVTVKFLTSDAQMPDLDTFYTLVQETLKRHKNIYTLPDRATFGRIFTHMPFILAVAVFEGKWIAYNLSLYNPNKTAVERVFAGANETGLRMRSPSFIEISMVEHLTSLGIKTYDLWGIKEGDGFTEFKKSLADEIKHYSRFSIIKVGHLAILVTFLIKLTRLLKSLIR
jgi:FemAB family